MINFQHFGRLAFDAWYARSWWDKARVWFMPTGWRPADVAERFPREGIANVYDFEKYAPKASRGLQFYAVFQLLFNTALMLFLFGVFADLTRNEQLLYGLMIITAIFGFTSVMDRKIWSMYWELVRSLFGLGILYVQGDWFGLNSFGENAWLWMAFYFGLNALWVAYFCLFEFRKSAES
ncbi:hypothetical protein [Aureicoccus marinus]|uniref:hypothetical protein n=1 Tax=Aureicoccus marinus TaxID=754435 RepID=UPI002936F0CE|nr:hypothetical protein [Aureicoccus marinus]